MQSSVSYIFDGHWPLSSFLIHIYISVHAHVCTHSLACVCTSVCAHVCTHTRTHACHWEPSDERFCGKTVHVSRIWEGKESKVANSHLSSRWKPMDGACLGWLGISCPRGLTGETRPTRADGPLYAQRKHWGGSRRNGCAQEEKCIWKFPAVGSLRR